VCKENLADCLLWGAERPGCGDMPEQGGVTVGVEGETGTCMVPIADGNVRVIGRETPINTSPSRIDGMNELAELRQASI
jgi:hypothetical protein